MVNTIMKAIKTILNQLVAKYNSTLIKDEF